MTGPVEALKAEPIAVTEALKNLLLSTLALLQVFKVIHLDDMQQAVIMAEYVAASVALSALARSLSTPTRKVALTTAQADLITASKGTP